MINRLADTYPDLPGFRVSKPCDQTGTAAVAVMPVAIMAKMLRHQVHTIIAATPLGLAADGILGGIMDVLLTLRMLSHAAREYAKRSDAECLA
jgi:hypothetical protein